MKTEKTLWHIFDASAFDEELGLLNEMSEKGWQLADMRVFTQRYVRDDSAVYRYAVDYQHELSAGEFQQYRAEFEDQGWAYVTKHGDWYVFRKPYDPSLPEAEYLLYTDEPSFRDMKRKYVVAINALCILWLPNLLLYPSLTSFLILLAWLCGGVSSLLRWLRFRRVRRVPKPYRRHLWRYSGALAALLLVLGFVSIPLSAAHMREFETGWEPGPGSAAVSGMQSTVVTIKLPDLCGIYAYAERSDISSVPYWITDEDGELVCSGVLTARERVNRFFWPGVYTLTVDWGPAPADPDWHPSRFATIGYAGSLLPPVPAWSYLVWVLAWLAVMLSAPLIAKKTRGRVLLR